MGPTRPSPGAKGQNTWTPRSGRDPPRRHSGQFRGIPRSLRAGPTWKPVDNAADGWPPILPWAHRLSARPADGRKHGGTRCPALDAPSLLIVEAMGPWNVSWPAAQACRHLPPTSLSSVTTAASHRHVSFETVLGLWPRATNRRPTGTSSAVPTLAAEASLDGSTPATAA